MNELYLIYLLNLVFNDNYALSWVCFLETIVTTSGFVLLAISIANWIEEKFSLNRNNEIFILFTRINASLTITFLLLSLLYCFVYEREKVFNQNHIILIPFLALITINIFYEDFPSFIEKITKYRIKIWLPFFLLAFIKFILGIHLGNYSQASFIIYTYDFSGELEKDIDLAIYFTFALVWKYFCSFSIYNQSFFLFPFWLSINRLISIPEINNILLELFSEREAGLICLGRIPGTEIATSLIKGMQIETNNQIVPYKKPTIYKPIIHKEVDVPARKEVIRLAKYYKVAPLISNEDHALMYLTQIANWLKKSTESFSDSLIPVINYYARTTKLIQGDTIDSRFSGLNNVIEIAPNKEISIKNIALDHTKYLEEAENAFLFKKDCEEKLGFTFYYNRMGVASRDKEMFVVNPSFKEGNDLMLNGIFGRVAANYHIHDSIVNKRLTLREISTLHYDHDNLPPFKANNHGKQLVQNMAISEIIYEENYTIIAKNNNHGQGEVIVFDTKKQQLFLLEVKVITSESYRAKFNEFVKKIFDQINTLLEEEEEKFINFNLPIKLYVCVLPEVKDLDLVYLNKSFKEVIDNHCDNKDYEHIVEKLNLKRNLEGKIIVLKN